MSMPKIPDLNPEININRDDAVNILIASIGLEEIALSHILNAEGEKIQYVLGTLEGQEPPEDITICDILAINDSVNKTLRNAMATQLLLALKLEDALKLSETGVNVETITIEGTKTWDDNDDAEGIRPDTIDVFLLRDGVVIKTITLDSFGDGKYTFANLPVWKTADEKYVYTIDEQDIDNYNKTIDGFNITNTIIIVP